jgi:hypothetical protein
VLKDLARWVRRSTKERANGKQSSPRREDYSPGRRKGLHWLAQIRTFAGWIRVVGVFGGGARPKGEQRRNGDEQGRDDMQRLHRTKVHIETVQPLLSGKITLRAKRTDLIYGA